MDKELNERRRKKVGFLLMSERKCQHINQKYVARKMGVRQELISKIEASKRRIDIIELIGYCEALNLTLTEFAWKIETYLHAEGLLPPPKSNIRDKKIGIEVSWCENKFSASFREIVPKTIVLTANTFAELQKEARNTMKKLVKALDKAGHKVPWWLRNEKYEFEYKFLDARSLLNAYSPYISHAVISKTSEINPSLLSQYAKGLKKAGPNQLRRITDAINKIVKKKKY
ncbi:MAG: helix-turn-helix transcriptional regulator [Bacteroidaceae bacterium]|nr:helix-turn-helix transcriptional regulator [Bacteroidaceae bacterium]